MLNLSKLPSRCTFSLSVNLPRLSLAVLFTVTIPCTRVGCIIANLRFLNSGFPVAVARQFHFPPCDDICPCTISQANDTEGANVVIFQKYDYLLTLSWSRMVTSPTPICCMVGNEKSLGKSWAPGSCPGIATWRNTDLGKFLTF